VNGFGEEDAALLTSTSIDLKRDSAVSTILAAVAGSPMWPSTRATWSESRDLGGLGHFPNWQRREAPFDKSFDDSRADSLATLPVTMADFRVLLMVVYSKTTSH